MYTPLDMLASTGFLPDASADAAPSLVAPSPAVTVVRPDGLRRGVWEGPSWVFGVIAGVLVVMAVAWAIFRVGPKRVSRFFRARPK